MLLGEQPWRGKCRHQGKDQDSHSQLPHQPSPVAFPNVAMAADRSCLAVKGCREQVPAVQDVPDAIHALDAEGAPRGVLRGR